MIDRSIPERVKSAEFIQLSRTDKVNDIGRRFKKPFDDLLREEVTPELVQGAYVENSGVQRYFEDFISSDESSVAFITAPPGGGKTTYVRKQFKCENNVIITDDALIIPFALNGWTKIQGRSPQQIPQLIRERISNKVNIAARMAADFSNKKLNPNEFISFIHDHKHEVLPPIGPFDDPPTPMELVEQLETQDPEVYQSELLKFAMQNSDLRQVVVILDDIESLSIKVQTSIIKALYSFHTCLQGVADRTFSAKLLISCRHVTRQMLNSPENQGWFTTKRKDPDEYQVDGSTSLKEIFEARLKYLLGEYKADSKNKENYESAAKYLDNLISSLRPSLFSTVTQINSGRCRDAIASIKKVLINRRFVQRNKPVRAHFSIEESHYDFSPDSFLMSLLFGYQNICTPKSSSITNIFRNDKSEETDLCLFYCCLWINALDLDLESRTRKGRLSRLLRAMNAIGYDESSVSDALEILETDGHIFVETILNRKDKEDWVFASNSLYHILDLMRDEPLIVTAFRDSVYIPQKFFSNQRLIEKPVENLTKDEELDIAITLLKWSMDVEGRILRAVDVDDKKRYYKTEFGSISPSIIINRGISKKLKQIRNRVPESGKNYRSILDQIRWIEEWYD